MEKTTKKKLKLFASLQKERLWLEAMARDGWFLENITLGIFYTFQKGEPKNMMYEADRFNLPKKPTLEEIRHKEFFMDMADELKSCDIAVLCNINFNRELIKSARQLGVTTATDVHVLGDINDEYNRDFMENADILFLSDEKLPCKAEDFVAQRIKAQNSKTQYYEKVFYPFYGLGGYGC